MQTVLIPSQAQELSTSPNFTGQQLQLATRSAFLHTCCMQVVITGPSCVLSAFKTVIANSVCLLQVTVVCFSCWNVCYWKAVLVSDSCSPFLKCGVSGFEGKTAPNGNTNYFLNKDWEKCLHSSSKVNVGSHFCCDQLVDSLILLCVERAVWTHKEIYKVTPSMCWSTHITFYGLQEAEYINMYSYYLIKMQGGKKQILKLNSPVTTRQAQAHQLYLK